MIPMRPLWGRGQSFGPHVVVEGAWPVNWDPRVLSLKPAWPPWGRGLSPGPRSPRGGVAGLLGPARPPWGRGRFLRPRVASVVAWPVLWASRGRLGGMPVPWALHSRRGGVPLTCTPRSSRGSVVGPLGPARSPSVRGRSPGPRTATVGTWSVPWSPLGWWRHGESPVPRKAAVGTWPVL